MALQFPRFKLADDGNPAARAPNVVTPRVLRASLIARAKMWEEAGLVENVDNFSAGLDVTRDGNDSDRVNALLPPDIVNQFRVFAGLIQPTL